MTIGLFVSTLSILLGATTAARPSDFVLMYFERASSHANSLDAVRTSKSSFSDSTSQSNSRAAERMRAAVENVSSEGWIVRTVDVEQESALANRWNVRQVPTIIVLQRGIEIDRIFGDHNSELLKRRLPHTEQEQKNGLSSFPLLQHDQTLKHADQSNNQTLDPVVTAVASNAMSNTSYVSRASGQRNIDSTSRPNDATRQMPSGLPQDPLTTTVRIRIEDNNTIAFGTGTMISQERGQVVVLTCGHLFRDLSTSTQVFIEAPMDGEIAKLPAKIIDYSCDEMDIALISFPMQVSVPIATVAPRQVQLSERQSVASVGCDGGADPTRRDSHISKLNRYLGPANIEVAGAPVQGRSGGGLFNERNELIGVCYAADAEWNEGLYSGIDVVYHQIDKVRLNLPSTTNLVSPLPQQLSSSFQNPQLIRRDNSSNDTTTTQNTHPLPSRTHSPVEVANLTAIIRDRNGRERVVEIPSPSSTIVEMIENSQTRVNVAQNPTTLTKN